MKRTRRINSTFIAMLEEIEQKGYCYSTFSSEASAKRFRRDCYYMMEYLRQHPHTLAKVLGVVNEIEIIVKRVEGSDRYGVLLRRKVDLFTEAWQNRASLPPTAFPSLSPSFPPAALPSTSGEISRLRWQAEDKLADLRAEYHVETDEELRFILGVKAFDEALVRLTQPAANASNPAGSAIAGAAGDPTGNPAAGATSNASEVQAAASDTIKRLLKPRS